MSKFVGTYNGTAQIPKSYLVGDNQTIVRGSALVLTSGKAVLAGDAAAAGTTLGFAMEAITTTTATATDKILVDVNPASVYNMAYSGTGTVVLGAAYDWKADGEFDVADTTGGYFVVVGNIGTATADVMMANRFIQVG